MKLQGEDNAKLIVWFISHQPCKYIANANYMGNPKNLFWYDSIKKAEMK
jgi:hypothetical protein